MITFDFIIKNWKDKQKDAGFKDELEAYLDTKIKHIGENKIKESHMSAWMAQYLLTAAIAKQIDGVRYGHYYDEMVKATGRKVKVDTNERSVTWTE